MRVILIYSFLLIFGLLSSQVLPIYFGNDYTQFYEPLRLLSMVCLSYIMILVGTEFNIDKSQPKKYIVDYGVAATAAAFPWIFVAVYFVLFLNEGEWMSFNSWKESLLIARFSAPTSAGVLFSMLAAAGLSATWVFKKARILAIFDDLDTVLLMVPLKILFIGLRWQLFVLLGVMFALLVLAWKRQHTLKWKIGPGSFISYAIAITLACELFYMMSYWIDSSSPLHLEVLLPAFVLGMLLCAKHEQLEEKNMLKVSQWISALFMVLVGMSMPSMSGFLGADSSWMWILFHVLAVTIISNIGKCFVIFCYKKEASFKERLAVAIGMFPRGEVGAGIIIVTLSYGLGGMAVTVAMLSLCLNLVLTGVFIAVVKQLCLSDEASKLTHS